MMVMAVVLLVLGACAGAGGVCLWALVMDARDPDRAAWDALARRDREALR